MPFPFWWLGALVAAVFLSLVMTIFGVLLKLMNQAATEIQSSIVPSFMSGMRSWANGRRIRARSTSPSASEGDGPELDDTPPSPDLRLQQVHRAG